MNTSFGFFKNNLDAEARRFLGEDYKKVGIFPVPTENAVNLGYRYIAGGELSDVHKEEILNKLYIMKQEKFPDALNLVHRP